MSGSLLVATSNCIISFIVFSLLALRHAPLADLPPHCLHGDVLGIWEVHIGHWHPCRDDLTVTDPFCGYSVPDNPHEHGKL